MCIRDRLRIAETEKYAHVTFFFNGGVEKQYPGEDRILVKSPKVATYDLQPEMSAYEVTDKMVEACLLYTTDADGNLIYSGGWQNGKRQGHGTAFDKNGNVVYTGEWKDDRYENGILYRHVQNEDKA